MIIVGITMDMEMKMCELCPREIVTKNDMLAALGSQFRILRPCTCGSICSEHSPSCLFLIDYRKEDDMARKDYSDERHEGKEEVYRIRDESRAKDDEAHKESK